MKLAEQNQDELRNLCAALDKTALVATLDAAGRILSLNDKMTQALGSNQEEASTRPFVSFLCPSLSPELRNDIESQIAKFSPWKGRLSFVTRNGIPLWVEASLQPVSDSTGQRSRVIVIAFDISEQKAVEQSLIQTRAFQKRLMASAPVGFFLADSTGSCELINQKWTQMTGLNLRKAIGFSWQQAIHPEDQDRVLVGWNSLIQKGTPFLCEYRYLLPSGQITFVLASAVLIRDEITGQAQILRIEQDLSEQRKSEQIINSQRAQMISSSKLTALGEMASGIAHEINNPLAIILGSAELLKTTLEKPEIDPSRLLRFADTIIKTTSRIAKIIKSLRSMARDGENDAFEPKAISDLYDDVLEMCSARARSAEIDLTVAAIDDDLRIVCRPTQLAQALMNLINNAMSAVQPLSTKWVQIETHHRGDEIEIWVTDSGPGIAAELREKVFQPFFTTKPVGKGMGLGLSVAKSLVEQHGGTLSLDEHCSNTRFILRLPKNQSFQSKQAS